jgi:hypothetical protein
LYEAFEFAEAATLYGLVVGGATLENIHITFRPISTGGLIRQQPHFIKTQLPPP